MRNVLVFLGMISSIAYAQSYDFVGSMSPYSWNNTMRYLDTSKLIVKTPNDSDGDEVGSDVATYTPSASRTRQNLANFVKRIRAIDPSGGAQLEQMLASTDILGAIKSQIAPYGLQTNNVAHAYAVYWINAWEASRGIVGAEETSGRAQAVVAQSERGLSSSPAFASATDAQKQEMAEALFVQAALISASLEAAADNPTQLRALANAVLQGARASGLDLNAMTLTASGFQPVTRK